MARVKVSNQYRITIPRDVRRVIGLQPGQMVSVIVMSDVVMIVPDRNIAEMEGIFPGITLDGVREEFDQL